MPSGQHAEEEKSYTFFETAKAPLRPLKKAKTELFPFFL